jgi:predicted nucleotidyltransferase
MTDNFTNELRLKAVAKTLSGLADPFVLVGGAVVSLYAPRDAAPEQRPTNDVDVLVELASYGGYARLEERLREIGFRNDETSGVICRYRVQGIIVDVMPTEPEILGFSNRWYPEGFQFAENYALDTETTIRLFTPAYFVASKLEAFKGRGKGDFWGSSDFEDLVYVFDNAPDLGTRLKEGTPAVQTYLREEFTRLLNNPDFEDGILAHVERRYASARTRRILEMLREFVGS